MKKRPFPLGKVYGLLEPGPVVLVTTAYRGKTDVMAMSWHTMLEFEPPQLACVISGRNDSFTPLLKSRECVINIPSVEMASQVVACGNSHGEKTDKFAAFGLATAPAAQVQAPLLADCFANLECRIADTRMVNKYNLFMLEVVQAWIGTPKQDWRTLHHRGNGVFMVAGEDIKLPSKMK
jgi:flavin reductase (DIM6/NTAB) family NADH-FMN oxidoreductase RutF